MEIQISEKAKLDLAAWRKSGNTIVLKKIRLILESIQSDPFNGIGKPEALKHEFSGLWSRRITKKDRLVYEVFEHFIKIHSLKEHY